MVSLSLRLQCIKTRSKIAWNSFCFVFDPIALSLSFSHENVRLQTIVMEHSKCKYTHASHIRTCIQAWAYRLIGIDIYMEQKPCALFTPSSLRVDYIDVRSRRAELNKKPQHKQQQRWRRDAEIGKHGFMCACVWRVSHSPTHFFSFVSVACCHTTLFFLVAISQPFRVSYFISVSASLSLSRPFSYVVCYLPEIAMKIPKLISNVTTFIFFFCDSRAFHMTVLITS